MRRLAWVPLATQGMGLLILVGIYNGCSGPESSSPVAAGVDIPTYQAPETEYCGTVTVYTGTTVTITGTAQFKRREVYGTVISGGLGNPGGARPIRYAEVRILNSAGTVIQCEETSNTGAYSFVVPQSTSTLTIQITSRANNSQVKAYVYDDPRYNAFYSLETTFVPNASKALATLTAEATGDVKGGAFNILDQILEANVYLRSQVGNCSGTFASCTDFSVAPRATVYWKLGFNPGEYYGSKSSGLSFYLPGYSRLFVLGGIDGDYNSSDTDHFDNSVVLHEYGHFLEDNVFASDSPGGSHNGNKIIDPRLAWSEGWGNFFQAAVRNDPTYLDTEGNIDGSTEYLFYVNLEDQTRDVPVNSGEGDFREFSVTRHMWDALDNTAAESINGGTDNISSAFNQIWHSLTSTSGFLKPSMAFRQIGHWAAFQTTLGTTSWAGIRTMERQGASAADYAQYVTTSGACSYTLTPSSSTNDGTTDNGTFAKSHMLLNNDFYHLKISSTQSVTIVLTYQDANLAGTEADLDLYVYNESARFGVTEDMVGRSENEPTAGFSPANETETVSATLGPGNYLINVKAFTVPSSVGTAANYTLTLNGSQLCTASLP